MFLSWQKRLSDISWSKFAMLHILRIEVPLCLKAYMNFLPRNKAGVIKNADNYRNFVNQDPDLMFELMVQ